MSYDPMGNDMSEYADEVLTPEQVEDIEQSAAFADGENCFPYNCADLSDDADALASAGHGNDEDYNHWEAEFDDPAAYLEE